jgi:DNA replication protein DnaC
MSETARCRRCDHVFEFERALPPGASALAWSREHPAPILCRDCLEEVTALQSEPFESEAQEQTEWKARNIPRRYRCLTFADFVATTPSQQEALEACRDHADEGVYLEGRAGVGKTLLVACAIKYGLDGSLFVSITELLDDIRLGFSGGGHDLFARAKRAPRLVIDDLGAEQITDFARERIYVLLNERYNACLPLMVTTNCKPRLLAERIGEGVASRIAGLCARRIEVVGEDMRFRQPASEHRTPPCASIVGDR